MLLTAGWKASLRVGIGKAGVLEGQVPVACLLIHEAHVFYAPRGGPLGNGRSPGCRMTAVSARILLRQPLQHCTLCSSHLHIAQVGLPHHLTATVTPLASPHQYAHIAYGGSRYRERHWCTLCQYTDLRVPIDGSMHTPA